MCTDTSACGRYFREVNATPPGAFHRYCSFRPTNTRGYHVTASIGDAVRLSFFSGFVFRLALSPHPPSTSHVTIYIAASPRHFLFISMVSGLVLYSLLGSHPHPPSVSYHSRLCLFTHRLELSSHPPVDSFSSTPRVRTVAMYDNTCIPPRSCGLRHRTFHPRRSHKM